jgi:hypothetical protein
MLVRLMLRGAAYVGRAARVPPGRCLVRPAIAPLHWGSPPLAQATRTPLLEALLHTCRPPPLQIGLAMGTFVLETDYLTKLGDGNLCAFNASLVLASWLFAVQPPFSWSVSQPPHLAAHRPHQALDLPHWSRGKG